MVFTIYGHGGHLGHVTRLCHQFFISLYLKAFIKKLVQIRKLVFEKILFEFLYVHHLGPRSRNDLDLQYSPSYIQLDDCSYLLSGHWLQNPLFSLFPIEKPKLPNLTSP